MAKAAKKTFGQLIKFDFGRILALIGFVYVILEIIVYIQSRFVKKESPGPKDILRNFIRGG
ncbi:MAG: hypothetical protein ABIG42_01705 [bacterium]